MSHLGGMCVCWRIAPEIVRNCKHGLRRGDAVGIQQLPAAPRLESSRWGGSSRDGMGQADGRQLRGSPGASLLGNRQMLCWEDKWKSSPEGNRYPPAVCAVPQESWEQTGRGLEGSNVS